MKGMMMAKKMPPPTELEGGFIHIRAKVYRGTIRTRKDKRVVWTCKHNHYRPEYNARYSDDPRKVWETSGLNCGRAAYRQLLGNQTITGDPGLVGDPNFPLDLRDDVREAEVAGRHWRGRVTLLRSGHRSLVVTAMFDHKISGAINLDLPPTKGVTAPTQAPKELVHEWATAAWLLKGGVWGTVFQDPRVQMKADRVMPRAVKEILDTGDSDEFKKLVREGRKSRLVLPQRSTPEASRKKEESGPSEKLEPVRSTTPHIRVARNEKGRRVFEVVGFSDDVVDRFVHRGPAVERLTKITKGRA